jgi:hypothetical protein
VVLRDGFFYGPGTWYRPDGAIAKQVRNRELAIIGEGSAVSQRDQRSRYRTACLVRRKTTALQILSAAAVGRLDAVIFDTLQQYRTKS